MTFNNSVLLILKQSPGIDFNDLLTKIASRYKNPASARSALARCVKDLASFGQIKKEGSKLFITDKGLSSMSLEMKDKLVLRLNEEMKRPLSNLDEIVKLLVVLQQRGYSDRDLLNNAKENASFTISDIEELRKKIRAQRKHLKQMSLLLEVQIKKLEELDFNDSRVFDFNQTFVTKLGLFAKGQKIIVETKDSSVLEKLPEHWKKQSMITVEGESISLLMQFLGSMPSAKATLYLSGMKVILMAGKANCFASFNTLKSFSGLNLDSVVKAENNI